MNIEWKAHFDSFDAFSKVQPSDVNKARFDAYLRDRDRNTESWLGCESFEEVDRLARDGWTEGVTRIKEISDAITAKLPRVKFMRRKRVRGSQGAELDIHAVNRGSLDRAWSSVAKVERQGNVRSKKIRLIMDLSAPFSKSAHELFWNPAATLVLAQHFLKCGHAVEVLAARLTSRIAVRKGKKGNSKLVTFTVKAFDRALQIENLALMALAGVSRKYGFTSSYAIPRTIRDDVGCPEELTRAESEFQTTDCHTILTPKFYTEVEALEWINETLTAPQ